MKEIPLTQGQVALVDDEDFDNVSQYRWTAKKRSYDDVFYAWSRLGEVGTNNRVFLHAFLMGHRDGLQVDHIDRNGLNCQRHNLRWATVSQNHANKCRLRNNTSGYKGVWFDPNWGRWRAQIYINRTCIRLGGFPTAEAAAKAYDDAAREHFGEFSRVNFPMEGERAA